MSPTSPFTAATSPTAVSHDDSDDIWGNEEEEGPTSEEVLSDLPSLKRQHMTDGYREGLSVAKARMMQTGFDDGYPIGVQIALRAGCVLGVLEAYLACKAIDLTPGTRQRVRAAYDAALRDLSISNLLRDLDEDALLAAQSIPDAAETMISFWEGKVTAVYAAQRSRMLAQEVADTRDVTNLDTSRTDKDA